MIAYKVFTRRREDNRLELLLMSHRIYIANPEKFIIQRAVKCGPFQCYRNISDAEMWVGELWKVRIKESKAKLVWIDGDKEPALRNTVLADEFEILERIK